MLRESLADSPVHPLRVEQARFSVGAVKAPEAPLQLAVKRIIDATAAATALAALLPVAIVIAAFIKMDSEGPVFQRELRVGRNNVPFERLAFRCSPVPPRGKIETETGLTRVGRILRRTRLEALPQLWNVLWGDMSLVGPSPHSPDMIVTDRFYRDLVRGYQSRHLMKPGMTGLAQVRGPAGSDGGNWPAIRGIIFDIDYIRKFSLMLDFKILARTVANAFKRLLGL